MRIHARAAAITLSIICLAGAPSLLAHQQERAAAGPCATRFPGDLVKVDDTAKTITVKAADGVETVLAYNDVTTVTGARDVAGLATMTTTKVNVAYTENAATKEKTATKIEVQAPAFMPAPAPAPTPAPETTSIAVPIMLTGNLVIVNTNDKTITVRSVEKVDMILLYTDATTVTGAKDIAGLSSMANEMVTVSYTVDPVTRKKTITKIVVSPK